MNALYQWALSRYIVSTGLCIMLCIKFTGFCVCAGPQRGQRARLLQRSTTASAAAVQLTSDLSAVKLAFDDIAEYLGEAGDEE